MPTCIAAATWPQISPLAATSYTCMLQVCPFCWGLTLLQGPKVTSYPAQY